MAKRYTSTREPDARVVNEALIALSVVELRELIGDMLPKLDERSRVDIVNRLIERAVRSDSTWTPAQPSAEAATLVVAFAKAARLVGHADPADVDKYLQQGSNAFLGNDYATAMQIFSALLLPIAEVEIDLGQHETVDEVLGSDIAACAAQYVVSVYMTSPPDQRGLAVRDAIELLRDIGAFHEPLREMERVAVVALPEYDEFLKNWRGLIEEEPSMRRHGWDEDRSSWLRDVVQRTEGSTGLAGIARSTHRHDDLWAWCRALFEAKDWQAALPAYDEAASLADRPYFRGVFLDGAALAAQELGRRDLPARLERAWREAPSEQRLCRWLGSSGSKRTASKRATQALGVCPKTAHCQRALLHVLLGDHESAAKLLAAAPGLGWSDSEHPGHMLFPLFHSLFGGAPLYLSPAAEYLQRRAMDLDEHLGADNDEPQLATPSVDQLLAMAGVSEPADARTRQAILKAMRTAAAKRLAGVTEHKCRRYYGHAAQLVATCAAVDSTTETTGWVTGVRAKYRRFPALQGELNRHLPP
jgi:tetratricopeptide (TPR) repeat protein